MAQDSLIPAALALEGVGGDARGAFEIAADAGYRGIAFATNHRELNPDALGPSARRHLKTLLSGKQLNVESLRAAAPRSGLTDPATIDRTLENARKAMVLARELGVGTISLHVGNLSAAQQGGISEGTVISAIRELSQQADASGLTLALSAEGTEQLARVLKAVDFERAKVNLDAARLIGAGEDVLQVAEHLAAIGGRKGGVGQFTAADAVRSGSTTRATMLGEGQLPLTELMEILAEQGFSGPMVVDVRDLPNGAAGARHAAEVLRRLLRS